MMGALEPKTYEFDPAPVGLLALALAGLQARQVMGYTAVVMFFAFFIMAAGLTLLPA